jgi:hypothetical protein
MSGYVQLATALVGWSFRMGSEVLEAHSWPSAFSMRLRKTAAEPSKHLA